MNNEDQKFIVEKIRSKYTDKQSEQLDELRRLDRKVYRPANVFAYVFGSLSAIVMGSGMSLIMTDIGAILAIENTMVVGIVTGVIGMLGAIINYPIYKKILASRHKKYKAKILEISEGMIK